jgi:hypothetical protein
MILFVKEIIKKKNASNDYLPVDPNPPSPLFEFFTFATFLKRAEYWGASTICAMR